MNILVRHHVLEGVACLETEKTGAMLDRILAQSAPRFSAIGINLALETVEHPAADETAAFANLISFDADDDAGERALDEILGLGHRVETCTHEDGTSHPLRTVLFEGQSYRAVPPGLAADALLRLALSGLEGCGGGCESCGCGCGGH